MTRVLRRALLLAAPAVHSRGARAQGAWPSRPITWLVPFAAGGIGDISSRVQENLSGVRVVRAFTREASEVETFKRMNHEYVERNRPFDSAARPVEIDLRDAEDMRVVPYTARLP